MKITFIHVSRELGRTPPIYLMPVGLNALANFLSDRGVDAGIIHLGLEKRNHPDFDPVSFLHRNGVQLVGLNLHWHHQSHAVMTLAREIKSRLPSCHVLLGGFTASLFAPEIMDRYPQIDFIIRGDAEIPLLNLVRSMGDSDGDLKSVPNLIWRSGKEVLINPRSFTIDQSLIDSLRFSDFSLLNHHDQYLKHLKTNECMDCKANCGNIFFYICGRGCPTNCSFCGGSNTAQKMINNRPEVILISHEAVIRELSNAVASGIEYWYNSFDPFPKGSYYIELFKKMRQKKLMGLKVIFECWSLPSTGFMDEFSKTFSLDESVLALSPESGSEYVRKKNKGYYFSNAALTAFLESARERNIQVLLFFAPGLAFENREHVVASLAFIRSLKKFRNVTLQSCAIDYEPGAPVFSDPDGYGIISELREFRDFYRHHDARSDIGYHTIHLSKREILAIQELSKAEYRCLRPRSFFLESLTTKRNGLESCDFCRLAELCRPCEHYERCFAPPQPSACKVKTKYILDNLLS